MKCYPYQSLPIEDSSSKTTFIVKSAEPLKQEQMLSAIEDVSLERTGWRERHPKLGKQWTFIEVFAPPGFGERGGGAVISNQ
jgi:hypothetical protein